MEPWVQQIAVPLAVAVLTSSGLWALVSKRADKNDVERKMLVGLAHDRIIHLGMAYLTRGYITQDEYENLNDYLYQPYEKMGGNGSAKRVMEEVRKLPIKREA
nr:MAG TPA: holin protein [Caudoviricetes sp.]